MTKRADSVSLAGVVLELRAAVRAAAPIDAGDERALTSLLRTSPQLSPDEFELLASLIEALCSDRRALAEAVAGKQGRPGRPHSRQGEDVKMRSLVSVILQRRNDLIRETGHVRGAMKRATKEVVEWARRSGHWVPPLPKLTNALKRSQKRPRANPR